ncbi:MAG TPA: CpaF family protein [Gallionella sp.]|nr:CpaF family protein [Gallionella sp.]
MKETDFDFTFVAEDRPFHETDEYQKLKQVFHEHLVDRVGEIGADYAKWSQEAVAQFISRELDEYLRKKPVPINAAEIQRLVRELTHEMTGLGPLEDLLRDDAIEDIFINGYDEVYITRHGRLERCNIRFIDDRHVIRIVHRILAPLGRRLDESSPMVDARLHDGSRINAIIPPLAIDGPAVSIRKFRRDPLKAGDLLAYGTLTQEMLDFLQSAVNVRCNILISGGTGAGKTTLLNILAQYIGENERVVTIEDAAELHLHHEHVVRLETRPGLENQSEVAARDLVRNSLRMRPDRIILGEVRGVEAVELLQAMNTGHDGSMSTIHSNSPRECLHRLQLLLNFGGFMGSELNLSRQIAGAIDIIVQISRLPSGTRRITSISEVTGVLDEVITMQELFHFERNTTPGSAVEGQWICNRMVPHNPKLAGVRVSWA